MQNQSLYFIHEKILYEYLKFMTAIRCSIFLQKLDNLKIFLINLQSVLKKTIDNFSIHINLTFTRNYKQKFLES